MRWPGELPEELIEHQKPDFHLGRSSFGHHKDRMLVPRHIEAEAT